MSRITRTGSVPLGHRAERQPGREPLAPPECREPDHLLQQWPPWAPSSSAARAPAAGTGPAGAPRAGSPAPAVATLGAELISSPGASRRHRPRRSAANRITGSGHPWHRADRQLVGQQQTPASPERREPDHRQWLPWAPSSSAARAPTAGTGPRRSGASWITGSGHPGRRAHQQPGRQPQAPAPAGAPRTGSPTVATHGTEPVSSWWANRQVHRSGDVAALRGDSCDRRDQTDAADLTTNWDRRQPLVAEYPFAIPRPVPVAVPVGSP